MLLLFLLEQKLKYIPPSVVVTIYTGMSDSVYMQVYMNGERCVLCRLGVVHVQAASVLVPVIIYL